eukprot:gnl/TRDRNA2_/TRDRNA2_174043_c4_seq4.p1 gnl/TRDRNA2_/TRDRNA2_174043_c4~~gnl/TRDRNA2_/TRDRNA2_174043_c4_seq4.p1  ORF type:complete len:252 (-),score=42.09 gnl/TRDRNA2_/TRDRNA2_174043_c4_seq4:105-860(-)
MLVRLSDPLRMELHYEVYNKWLSKHPFFASYGESNLQAMLKICHTAVAPLQLSQDDIIFSTGETAKSMYFVDRGKLLYNQPSTAESSTVAVGSWVCEMVLWTPWVHNGSLYSTTEASLIVLDARTFHDIVLNNKSAASEAANYACEVVDCLNRWAEDGRNEHSDLHGEVFDPVQIAAATFYGDDGSGGTTNPLAAWLTGAAKSTEWTSEKVAKILAMHKRSSLRSSNGSTESEKPGRSSQDSLFSRMSGFK